VQRTVILFLTFIVLCTWAATIQNTPTKGGNAAAVNRAVSGTVRDAKTGETMTGASVFIKELPTLGANTNAYGFYSLTLPQGKYTLVCRYIGYNDYVRTLDSTGNQSIVIKLSPASQELQEVEISAHKAEENVRSTEMGVTHLDIKELDKIPVIFGERDVLKSIQLLPGVIPAGEGSTGFYVRGGGPDENLILLDEAVVYNPGHLLGFFSVFNSDAIKDVTLYKGNMPAMYGGRLSSVVDVKMKEGNQNDYIITGGIGLIASRLSVEGPIVKDKGSFLVTARRTYADLFLKLSSNPSLRTTQLYFYDINVKANYNFGLRDHVFLSGYFGQDIFGSPQNFGINYGNITGTARWNHIFSDKLFSNTSLIFNDYNYLINIGTGLNINVKSVIKDYNVKEDMEYYFNSKNKIGFGFLSTVHTVVPGVVTASDSSPIKSFALSQSYGLENAVYAQHEVSLWDKVNINYGVRLSIFSVVGPGNFYSFPNSNVIDTFHLNAWHFGRTYVNPEPRFSVSYNFYKNMSIKAAYSRNSQNLHLLSNTTSSSPTDRWLLTDYNVRPELSDQGSLGYYLNFYKNMFELSVEGYYKWMQNEIDYKNGAELNANETVESELLYGKGQAYGGEFFLKKKAGKITGWISYTLSRTERQFPGVNNNAWYPAVYDRTHDLNIVFIYDVTPKINLSATFVYYTGNAATFPIGKYEINGSVVPYYGLRDQNRFPPYNRLDIGATFKLKQRKNWEHDLNVSVYNVYARENPYTINFVTNNSGQTVAQELYLFRIVPSVTYDFKFTAVKKQKANPQEP